MRSQRETVHARARLQLETPVSNDADLASLQEQTAKFVREATHRDRSKPDELVTEVIDAVGTQRRRVRAFSVLMILVSTAFFVAPVMAQTPYDGLWIVTVVTKTGDCEPTSHYPVTVVDGKISGASDVSGNVGREGLVRASLHGAFANGQLSGNVGAGKWNAASAGKPCSGRWMATRQ